jgi:hypothetical protein
MTRPTFASSSALFPKGLFSLAILISCCAASTADAEQKERLGAYTVHYVVVSTMFFNKDIATRYQIVRGADRALMNLSILDSADQPVSVSLEGTATNLLGQMSQLEFREVKEGSAIYYLAPVRYSDRETLRFKLNITTPDGVTEELAFQQQMFLDGR